MESRRESITSCVGPGRKSIKIAQRRLFRVLSDLALVQRHPGSFQQTRSSYTVGPEVQNNANVREESLFPPHPHTPLCFRTAKCSRNFTGTFASIAATCWWRFHHRKMCFWNAILRHWQRPSTKWPQEVRPYRWLMVDKSRSKKKEARSTFAIWFFAIRNFSLDAIECL